MVSSTVEIIYRHPNPKVMVKGARILQHRDPQKNMHYCEPEERMVDYKGKSIKVIVYVVPIDYARRLLSMQPDRFFLLSPEKLIITKYSKDRLSNTNEVVRSIVAEGQPPPEQPEPAAEEEKPPAGPVQEAQPETATQPVAEKELAPAFPPDAPPAGEGEPEKKDEGLPEVPDPNGPPPEQPNPPAGAFARPHAEE